MISATVVLAGAAGAAGGCRAGEPAACAITCTSPGGCLDGMVWALDGYCHRPDEGPAECSTAGGGDAASGSDGAVAAGVDASAGRELDAAPVEPCPPDMLHVAEADVCVDRYEASRGEGGVAVSARSRAPWINVNWFEARDGCVAAGKRLCRDGELLSACRGPGGEAYPYGDVYVGSAWVEGLFDMSGNAWEWTVGGGTRRIRGGGWNVGGDPDYLACDTFQVDQPDWCYCLDNLGFRCCRDPG